MQVRGSDFSTHCVQGMIEDCKENERDNEVFKLIERLIF